MRYFCTTIILLLTTFSTLLAQPYTTTIPVEAGEKWWGLSADMTIAEPFTEPFEWNTAEGEEYEFRMAALLSSAGRYVWSAEPMQIAFDGNTFTITS
ncbi:MAG: hypothetical protein IKC92_00335, partial [Tidjanibacter sp.]|nr:hypothetical protein [Tidjanibacter sp.]